MSSAIKTTQFTYHRGSNNNKRSQTSIKGHKRVRLEKQKLFCIYYFYEKLPRFIQMYVLYIYNVPNVRVIIYKPF